MGQMKQNREHLVNMETEEAKAMEEAFSHELEEIVKTSDLQPERFNHRLGLSVLDCSKQEKWVDFLFESGEWCKNPSGGVHGGVICSLFDTSIGMGAVALTQMNVTTTDLSVSFLKPFNGSQYVFHVEYTNVGRRMVRGIGKAYDRESGKLCASAMGSFMVIGSKEKALQV